MMRFSILWVSLLLLLLGGCATREYTTTETKLITFKSPMLRYNDAGFIRSDGGAVQAELFAAGQVVERFEIDTFVCVSKGCMTKSAFNAEYLYEGYPDALLLQVLTGQAIFKGVGRHRTDVGFEQRVKGAGYDIRYSVEPSEIYFKDRTNGILIRIRDLPASPETKK